LKRLISLLGVALVMPLLAVTLGLSGARDTLADGPAGLTPSSVDATIAPGSSLDIAKTVHTPAIPPKPDVIFLADTTGSMGPAIANVQTNAATVMSTVLAAQPDAQFGAADYTDFNCTDPFPYRLDQAITANTGDVQTAINAWAAGNGCDTPEAQLNALYQLATDPATGWRAGSTRIIAWFGDSSGHDPSNGHTLVDVITALQAAGIRVIAVPVTSGFGDGLDSTGQATAITTATGGALLPDAPSDQVAAAILEGLSNLPVEVSMATDCTGAISVSFSPASQTVLSGTDAAFTETISVAADAPQGTTIECNDWALLNGQPMTDAAGAIIYEHKTIHVPDVTPPEASCLETVNPAGKKVPPAGSTTLPGPKGGQNEDGFYQLLATDNVDPNPQIFVADSGSAFVAGPFASGDNVKITQAPGATPGSKPMAGAIVSHITLNGDALVYAVDASGNVSTQVSCLVPPLPK
jgi:hypothetical protein